MCTPINSNQFQKTTSKFNHKVEVLEIHQVKVKLSLCWAKIDLILVSIAGIKVTKSISTPPGWDFNPLQSYLRIKFLVPISTHG